MTVYLASESDHCPGYLPQPAKISGGFTTPRALWRVNAFIGS